MGYVLGIDVGTTFTAAAVIEEGRAEIVQLGLRAASVPSVVFVEGDTVLTGDAAQRRGVRHPDLVAREFKRRIGDPVPLLIGAAPLSAEAVFARMVRATYDAVVERQGGQPDALTVTHPANWGPYKLELLHQALEMADLGSASTFSEPEAAAIQYASLERVAVGNVVAVYDLGGGTFDAAVLAKTEDGFRILGTPAGIERLGGIDFDQAVVAHVARAISPALDTLDRHDPAVVVALARLHQECVEAKEVLWADTETSIPVSLPGLETEVRLTRGELEGMIRVPLGETISCMRRALRSADVEPGDLSAFLLVGGSSRIPMVAEMVHTEFGRRVAVDADPKHVVALGAARAAALRLAPATAASPAMSVPAAPDRSGSAPDVADLGSEACPSGAGADPVSAVGAPLVVGAGPSPAAVSTGGPDPDVTTPLTVETASATAGPAGGGPAAAAIRSVRRRRTLAGTAIGVAVLGLGTVAVASPWNRGANSDRDNPPVAPSAPVVGTAAPSAPPATGAVTTPATTTAAVPTTRPAPPTTSLPAPIIPPTQAPPRTPPPPPTTVHRRAPTTLPSAPPTTHGLPPTTAGTLPPSSAPATNTPDTTMPPSSVSGGEQPPGPAPTTMAPGAGGAGGQPTGSLPPVTTAPGPPGSAMPVTEAG